MKTLTAHAVVAALSAVAIMGGTAAHASAAEPQRSVAEQTDVAATPAAYVDFLRQSDEEGASDVLKQFQQLTKTEQHKFINYLHDPTLLKELLAQAATSSGNLRPGSQNMRSMTSFRNGDVTVGQESAFSGGISTAAKKPLPKGRHTVRYNAYIKYFGVKVIRLTLSVDFRSNGRDITKAYSAEATKKNLSGIISISHSKPKKGLSTWKWCPIGRSCSKGHNAEASVVWEGSIAFKGSTFQVDKKQYMQANVYGKLNDYYLRNV